MFKLEDLKMETLSDYIKHLFIIENLKRNILIKVNKINEKISEDEIMTVKINKDGNNKFNVLIYVTNNKLPKCFIIGNEYKFNSYIAEIISVCDLKIKD